MGLKGKMIGQTVVKHSGVGDVFHDLFSKRPHDLTIASPDKIQGFAQLEGGIGAVGSMIFWNYTHDGKERVAKQIIEEVDEVKQSIKFRMIEGDLLELYKTFVITYHVDTDGEDNLVTWTMEYEKLDELGPHPGTLLAFALHLIEDIEAHHLNQA
ncbi:OLC1v1032238C1 [Oldenlandia corymbosa var. corymbosa]|uniref:OLC1v1032238C1 n=1 Tax=Oldenlandia corymbosa var. corymbosa TaxID=529605 RepID=A0AAV1CLC0_OLDCO|nr:OLC1v1032238C1 [Oldenlandia corymbosa var. corymbosa]